MNSLRISPPGSHSLSNCLKSTSSGGSPLRRFVFITFTFCLCLYVYQNEGRLRGPRNEGTEGRLSAIRVVPFHAILTTSILLRNSPGPNRTCFHTPLSNILCAYACSCTAPFLLKLSRLLLLSWCSKFFLLPPQAPESCTTETAAYSSMSLSESVCYSLS